MDRIRLGGWDLEEEEHIKIIALLRSSPKIRSKQGKDLKPKFLYCEVNLSALKGGDSGGIAMAASWVVKPWEYSSGLVSAYFASNLPGCGRTTP